ncbi:MAG TPA: hypothetical protein VNH46_11305, partial [Gemmatimonadales bacterium]|nr:hypothetical protein [Gemmatimonadales bacterium]
ALGAGALALRSRSAPGPGHTSRFAIALPPGQGLLTPGGIRVAFAPDGQSFVYPGPGNGRPGLWRRRLDQLRATLIAGSEGATTPAFSPDGQNIAFVTLAPFALKVISAAGGTARTVVSDGISGGGVAWSSDGYLYFDGVTGLARVRPDGSDRSMVMPLDTLHGEAGVGWPEALPGGHGVLVRVRRTGEPLSAYRIVALDPRSGRRRDLVQAALARYSPTGHILFLTADGRLHAQRFDLERLELRGEPEVLWDGVALGSFGAGDVAVSTTGDLIYATGAIHNGTPGLVWVSRDGSTTPADSTSEDGIIRNLALSPDGSTAALQIMRPTDASDLNRIYVKRLPDGPTQLVTSEPVPARDPVWGSNGQEIFYTTGSPGTTLMKRRADGSGAAVRILSDPRLRGDLAVSVDGRTVLMKAEWRPSTAVLARYRVGEDTAPVPMPSISSFAPTPRLSPDGRWLAYVSSESGRPEIYVRPFPDVEARKVQVSVEGGVAPSWRPTGGELYYVGGNGDLTAATVRTTPTFD